MLKYEIRAKMAELIQEMVRDKGLAEYASTLDCVPDILDSVSVDTATILRCVDQELNRKTGNPLNALLSLFGLRIVHTRNTLDDLSTELGGSPDPVTLEVADSNKLAAFLCVDAAGLKTSIDKITGDLSLKQRDHEDVLQSLREQITTLHRELDKVSGQLSQANTDLDYQRNAVAERAQYMLSLAGESPADPLMGDQITELLADLELKACWSSEGTGLKDAAMFSVLKCDEPEKRKGKPCIMGKDQVLLKGVRFVADTAESESPSGEA